MAKKPSSSSSSSSKKQTSNSRKRLFTFNDEILILNHFFDFISETGQNIMTDYTPLYKSVKDLLSIKPTQEQLRKRIWKLNKKYEKMKKEENQKFPPRFYTVDEKKIFDISHMIWGQDNEEKKENAAKKEELESAVVVDKEEYANTGKMGFSSLREILQENMELIGESDRVELDRMLKELKVQEMELALDRAQVAKDSADAILKALQGSSSS